MSLASIYLCSVLPERIMGPAVLQKCTNEKMNYMQYLNPTFQKQCIRHQRSLSMQRSWTMRWWWLEKTKIHHTWKGKQAAFVCGMELFRCLLSMKLSFSPNWIRSNVCNNVKTVVLFSLTTVPTLVRITHGGCLTWFCIEIKIFQTIYQCGSVYEAAFPPSLYEGLSCVPAENCQSALYRSVLR